MMVNSPTVGPRSNGFQGINAFLVADKRLYKRLCPSVRPSVGLSVGNDRVRKCENTHFPPPPTRPRLVLAVYPALLIYSPKIALRRRTGLRGKNQISQNGIIYEIGFDSFFAPRLLIAFHLLAAFTALTFKCRVFHRSQMPIPEACGAGA